MNNFKAMETPELIELHGIHYDTINVIIKASDPLTEALNDLLEIERELTRREK